MHRLAVGLGIGILVAAIAAASVDVEVDLTFSVAGTISPSGEIDAFRFVAPEGALLTFSLAAKKAPGLDLDARLDGPGGPIDLDAFPGFADDGQKVSLKAFPLPDSGEYVLRITGTGTGEYALKVKGAAARSFVDPAFPVAAGGTEIFPFAAPTGAVVTLEVKPAAGTTAEPRFGKIWDDTDISQLGTFSTKGHKVTLPPVAEGGDLFVEVKNLSGSGGTFAVKASVKAPKPAARKIDCRGTTLGLPQGGETLVSRMIEAPAGGGVAVDDSTSTIDGAGVTIPPGALPGDRDVSIASAPAPDLPDDVQSGGPPVEFGPSGTSFGSPATVTVPYDPAGFPPDTEDGDIEVLVVEGDGSVQRISPDVIDPVNGVVQVAADSFSTFQVVVPKGPPALAGRQYWFFNTESKMIPGYDGGAEIGWQSRQRKYSLGRGAAAFGTRAAPGGVTISQNFADWEFTHTDNWQVYHDWLGTDPLLAQMSAAFDLGTSSEPDGGSWDYAGGGQQVTISFDSGDSPTLWLGADGRFLAFGPAGDGGLDAVLLVEKPSSPPTPSSLAGTWWFVQSIVSADSTGPDSPAELGLERGFGTITFKSDGTFAVSGLSRETIGDHQSIRMQTSSGSERGTFTVQGDGSVRMVISYEDEPDTVLRMMPDSGLGFMAGSDETPDSNEALILLLVRQSPGLTAVSGAPYRVLTLEWDLTFWQLSFHRPNPGGGNRNIVDVSVPDWRLWREGADAVVDVGGGQFTFTNTASAAYSRSPGVSGGVDIDTETSPGPENFPYSVGKNGRISVEGSVGVFTPDGALGVIISDPADAEEGTGFTLLLRLPPAKTKAAR